MILTAFFSSSPLLRVLLFSPDKLIEGIGQDVLGDLEDDTERDLNDLLQQENFKNNFFHCSLACGARITWNTKNSSP